jgi:hypothetical protein
MYAVYRWGAIQKLLVDHDHQEIIAMNETR